MVASSPTAESGGFGSTIAIRPLHKRKHTVKYAILFYIATLAYVGVSLLETARGILQ